jgi:hypothetical protein
VASKLAVSTGVFQSVWAAATAGRRRRRERKRCFIRAGL